MSNSDCVTAASSKLLNSFVHRQTTGFCPKSLTLESTEAHWGQPAPSFVNCVFSVTLWNDVFTVSVERRNGYTLKPRNNTFIWKVHTHQIWRYVVFTGQRPHYVISHFPSASFSEPWVQYELTIFCQSYSSLGDFKQSDDVTDFCTIHQSELNHIWIALSWQLEGRWTATQDRWCTLAEILSVK